MAKEKMDVEKKTKLIYSLELIFFAIVFFVIATLEILGLIGKRAIMHQIFNWVTIFGGTWMIIDCIWVLFSNKRREKNSLLDKITLAVLGIYLITFDIICFVTDFQANNLEFRRLMMGIAFYYVGAIYIFQGIYHYKYPIPMIVKAIEEEKQAAEENKKQEDQLPDDNREE